VNVNTSGADIANRAAFDAIRYAQVWEDADVLVDAMGDKRGATLVSICSAGDNALALLTLDPERVVALDLSPAQIACLRIRISAYRTLDHAGLLELLGSRPSSRRGALLDQVARSLDADDQAFWSSQRDDVIHYGLGGIGKFERYFRIFQTWFLPLTQSRDTIDTVFVSKPKSERRVFFDTRWNNWRWRLLLKTFFSNFVMGRLGRDPAFFDYVEGSLSDHVAERVRFAGVDLDPAENPYLHWVLKSTHGAALPLAWRAEQFDTIRDRLDRLELHCGSLEDLVASGRKADGFNLSDIFEYMDETVFAAVYGSILKAANPAARLVYWNMMVPRRVPAAFADRVVPLTEVEAAGKAADKAFFYSDFVVEEVR
jgi:S-adenosylmethionine-diacylglycerol 3-amino-3-carboxypropyl transferase